MRVLSRADFGAALNLLYEIAILLFAEARQLN